MNEPKSCDLIIIGAGPVGLSAAIFGAKSGLNVLLIEQGSRIGPKPGGETLRYNCILDKLFGDQFLDSISQFRTWDTRIFSPNTQKHYIHHEKPGVNAFEWEDLMNAFQLQLKNTSIKLKFDCRVKNVIINDVGVAIGVKSDSGNEFFATTIIDASGATSDILTDLTKHNHNIGYPIVKAIVTNYTDSFQGFSSFFLMKGSLKNHPTFPPITIFVFPHMNGRAEIGMMLFDDFRDDQIQELTDIDILEVWHDLMNNYPIFSDILAGSKVEFEFVTKIGSKNLIHNPVVVPGYIVVGAAGGFLEASHAAGLLTGMNEANLWIDYLDSKKFISWNADSQQKANLFFQSSLIYKFVAKSHKKIQNLKEFLYGKLKTDKNFHRIWPIFVMGKKIMG